MKKLGLSHSDIFGETRVEEREVEVCRDGVVGRLKDALFGKRKERREYKVRVPAMGAKQFSAYLDLMRDEAKRRKKEKKRREARQSLKGAAGF